MAKLNWSTSNSQITDELINVSSSTAFSLAHDVFYSKTGKLLEIWTGAGGTGTQLTESTDYSLSGIIPDADLPASISPDVAYTTVAITNATYHSTALYVSYYPLGDYVEAEDTVTQVLIIEDQKASGTNGGTFTSGAWQTRDLNTEVFNSISGASLSSNQFTLPAGTYKLRANAQAFRVNKTQARLYNVTDSVAVAAGDSVRSSAGSGDSVSSGINTAFTISESKIFRIEHQCETTLASNGFGIAAGVTFTVSNEVYVSVMVEKIN